MDNPGTIIIPGGITIPLSWVTELMGDAGKEEAGKCCGEGCFIFMLVIVIESFSKAMPLEALAVVLKAAKFTSRKPVSSNL
jgi:hypothetical protein